MSKRSKTPAPQEENPTDVLPRDNNIPSQKTSRAILLEYLEVSQLACQFKGSFFFFFFEFKGKGSLQAVWTISDKDANGHLDYEGKTAMIKKSSVSSFVFKTSSFSASQFTLQLFSIFRITTLRICCGQKTWFWPRKVELNKCPAVFLVQKTGHRTFLAFFFYVLALQADGLLT